MTCDRCGEELVENALHVCPDAFVLAEVRYHQPAAPMPRAASGIGRIVVGYRENDRRVNQNRDLYGLEPRVVRRCYAGCGHPVFFYSGGVDAVSDRDAEVVCTECKELYYPELMAEL